MEKADSLSSSKLGEKLEVQLLQRILTDEVIRESLRECWNRPILILTRALLKVKEEVQLRVVERRNQNQLLKEFTVSVTLKRTKEDMSVEEVKYVLEESHVSTLN